MPDLSLGKETIQVTASQLLLLWRHCSLCKLGQLKLAGLLNLNSLSWSLPRQSLANAGAAHALGLLEGTATSGAGVCCLLESSKSVSRSWSPTIPGSTGSTGRQRWLCQTRTVWAFSGSWLVHESQLLPHFLLSKQQK